MTNEKIVFSDLGHRDLWLHGKGPKTQKLTKNDFFD